MPVKPKKLPEIGQSGTQIQDGFISEEVYNKDLEGKKGLIEYDKMRKTDATVRISLMGLFLPILSAHWFIEPGSDDSTDTEASDFVEDNLFKGMTITWRDTLRQALLHVVFGYWVDEIVYEYRKDGKIHWRKFAPRLPRSISKWVTLTGENGVTQVLSDGKEVSIPIEKLVIWVNEKEGDNWEGISILRSAYPHYYLKNQIYKIDAMAHERQGLGIPYFKRPAGALPDDVKKAQTVGKNIRANKQAYVEYTEGWEFGFLDMKGNSIKNPEWSINHHNMEIVLNVLMQFILIGTQNSGAYAASNNQSELFMLSLEFIANHIAEGFNNYAIPKLVDMNFRVGKYPTLKFSKIKKIDLNTLSTALQRFAQTELLTPNNKTEDWIRDQTDMPEITDEDRAEEELMAFLDEMEGKPVGIPIQQQMPFDNVKQTPQQVTADEGEIIEGAFPPKDNNQQPPMNPMVEENIAKKNKLKQLITEKKIWLLEQQKRGNPITQKKAADIKIEILELQSELDAETIKQSDIAKKEAKKNTNNSKSKPNSKPNPADTKEAKKANEILLQMMERMDDAISKLEEQL